LVASALMVISTKVPIIILVSLYGGCEQPHNKTV